jgi:outer membrane protein TolC
MKVLYLLLLLFSTTKVLGQSVNYDKVIIPEHIKASQMEERLVQLAWQNSPQGRVGELEQVRAEAYATKANWDWLNRVTVSGNLNEFTIDPAENARAEYYPRYNFNVSIPLGVFVDQAKNAKIARTNVAIEEEQIKLLKLRIRTEVLTRYEDHIRTKTLLTQKLEVLQKLEERQATLNLQNPKPTQGELSRIEDQIKQVEQDITTWTSNTKMTKLRLEEYIGVQFEEVYVE